MKMKLLVAFAAAGLSVAAAKSYDISLSQAVRVGSTQLPPGTYKLKVEASKVTLMDPNTGRTVTADAKVSTADKKYDHTAIVSKKVDGADHIDEIDLGGTKTKIQFND
ncbi:MAG TPA: hypothetical protein VFA33_00215 [Bryobacteraceae bacterium]|nr:hypothetical protein [Bryobacteraceae bacterium]